MYQKPAYISRGLLFIMLSVLLCTPSNQALADIYRFVTIDGIETFTDAPMEKDAKLVMKSTKKQAKKGTAKEISKGTHKTPAPSLQEIVEKTVQNQLTPSEPQTTIETVLPVSGHITSGVGMRIDPIDGTWRHHNGIDIAVPTGTPVSAVAGGTVIYAGLRSGYGFTVLLEHDNGMITLYGHNSQNTVSPGQAIKKGDTIALAGSTGRSTGPHVHFEAWQSGSNVTAAFMPGSQIRLSNMIASNRTRASFRKEVLNDGSMLITNIPNSIP
jgi:murein DD-endopeptidase MepM/ murein hydrolase activator NlpD